MKGELVPIPDRGTPITLDALEELERRYTAALASIDDVDLLEERRAQAAALEVYLRNRNLQGPMLGTQRRIEARIGQLISEPYSRVGIHIHDPARAAYRLLARALAGEIVLGDEEWRQSRRALIADIRKMLWPDSPPLPTGRYRCVVIDPPWPVQRVEQNRRPLQAAGLDYRTLEIEEIDELVGLALTEKAEPDGCHVYLWTTHRFLPKALEMFAGWGARYQCLLTWVKPTGVSPFSWMYDTEHVLFGRIGALKLERMGLRLSITAPSTRGHSVKPPAFYERVVQASPGPRLAMFERGEREGFDVWGDEVAA